MLKIKTDQYEQHAIKTDHYESLSAPDEDYRRARRAAEVEALQRRLRRNEEVERARRDSLRPLLRIADVSDADLAREAEEEQARARRFREEGRQALVSPPIDYRPSEEQEIRLLNARLDHANAIGGLRSEHDLIWQGVDHRPDGDGYIWERNGNDEELPWRDFDVPAGRFDARVQAGGETSDFDYSFQRAWLTFKLIPPTWGRLEIHAGIWLHGFYDMSSSDKWWTDRFADVFLGSFVEVVQDFTHDSQFTELLYKRVKNGSDNGRIDQRSWHFYSTDIAAENELWFRIGITQQASCQGAGTFAEVNFAEGPGNYCWVPYVQYFLHRS